MKIIIQASTVEHLDTFIFEFDNLIVLTLALFTGLFLSFLLNRPAGQVLSKSNQPNCKLTSLATESQQHYS